MGSSFDDVFRLVTSCYVVACFGAGKQNSVSVTEKDATFRISQPLGPPRDSAGIPEEAKELPRDVAEIAQRCPRRPSEDHLECFSVGQSPTRGPQELITAPMRITMDPIVDLKTIKDF